MDRRKRNKKEEIRVNWDITDFGDWHYVPRSSLTLLPGSHFEAGGRVAMKWKGDVYHGTIAASSKPGKKQIKPDLRIPKHHYGVP